MPLYARFNHQQSVAELLLLAHSDSVLRLVHQRLVVVVRVRGEGVADFLSVALLRLRLERRGEAVARSLDMVTHLLGGGFLAVGLQGSAGLVSHALATSVRHCGS